MKNTSTTAPLWRPKESAIKSTRLCHLMQSFSQDSYQSFYRFSVENPSEFWNSIWDNCGLRGEKGERVVEHFEDIEKAIFFPSSKLNFAENLLKKTNGDTAFISYNENGFIKNVTFEDLNRDVLNLSKEFRKWGVKSGDRIAGYLPNISETIVCMLATARIGAIWSSCSPDFGVTGVVDRFGQIEPTVFIAADGYFYNGKHFSCLDKIPEITQNIKSIKHTIIIPYTNQGEISHTHHNYKDLISSDNIEEEPYERFPFNHPLYILFSSGTTGVPKCIVHGAGGTLIQHLKEHQLHCDIHPGDRVFYYTTCGWMMWNWLVSALASNATLILYDGNPVYPKGDILFDIIDETGITHFGTSAKYIDGLSKMALKPGKTHKLRDLRMIMSTGSPLVPESFDYVYGDIKSDVCLASISGGTDIVSCFALGNPIGSIWRGELQTPGLGMKVEVFNDEGTPVVGEKGELVCTAPFPSRPLGFWNDPTGEKYHNAYYSHYKNTWYHGDFVEFTEHGGLIIYGRSDSVLNPGGVRIGTAEIYRQVEKIPEVMESITVGQNWNNDVRVILFVKLKNGIKLSDELIEKIKKQIRQNTTPRHVPSKIIQVTDIPRTKSGKIVELAVRNVIHNEPVKNIEALANPEALDNFKNLPSLSEN